MAHSRNPPQKMKATTKRERLKLRALFGPMPKTVKKPPEPISYQKGESLSIDIQRFKHLDGFDLRAALSDKEVMEEFSKIHKAKIRRILDTPSQKRIAFPKRKKMETLILLAEVKKRVDVRRERADKFVEKYGSALPPILNTDAKSKAENNEGRLPEWWGS